MYRVLLLNWPFRIVLSPLQRHRDTEKANGMFGTLVVQLPSDYSGGHLVVSHGGQDKVFDFSGIKGCTNFHYAAFYADCQHELKKVTKGYRLCLIYNLIYSGTGSLPAPTEDALIVGQLTQAMQQWNTEASRRKGPPIMAYILEHKYCEASLSFKGLKNVDRAVGDILTKACQEANFDLYLAHVSRMEMWSASCYRKKYTLVDLCENSIDASHFISPQGQKPDHFSEMFLDDGAMVPKENYKLGKPDEEERSEATGNEGASVERWYKWTALVLWPQKRRLMNIGCDRMTHKLKMAVIGRTTPLTAAEKEDSLKLARELAESGGHSSTSAVTLLQCLQSLGQTELIREFLSSELSDLMLDTEFRKVAFSLCGSSVDWEVIRPSLLEMIKVARYFISCCDLLKDLLALSLKNPSAAQPISLCKETATAFVKAVSNHRKYVAYSSDTGVGMLKVLLSLGDASLISEFLLFLASATYERYSNIDMFLCSQPFVEQLLAIGKALGWETLRSGLVTLFKNTTAANITEYCNLLCRFVCHEDLPCSAQLPISRSLMDIIIGIVVKEQDFDPKAFNQSLRFGTSWDYRQDQERRAANSSRSREFVCSLLKILVALEYDTVMTENVTDALFRQPNRYPLSTVVLPALEDVRSWLGDFKCNGFISIVARFISVIQGLSKPAGPSGGGAPPKGWSKNVTVTCGKSCDDCKSLQEFIRDPAKNQIRFRVNQVRRSHVERQLNILKCGTTHYTERTGSPMTLVVSKVGGRPVQEIKQDESLRILARLRALCPPQQGGASVAGAPQPKKLKIDAGVPPIATGAPRH